MQWTRPLSRWLAVLAAGLFSISGLVALIENAQSDAKNTPAVPNPNVPAAEIVPLFTKIEPAKNQPVLILQADERAIHGWVAGSKSFAGKKVITTGERPTISEDNTFSKFILPKTGVDRQMQIPVTAQVDIDSTHSLVAHTTVVANPPPKGTIVFFITDRSAYRPGQTLKFIAFLRTLLPSGEFAPSIRESNLIRTQITVKLTSATKHTTVASITVKTDWSGHAVGEYTFKDSDPLDRYFLTADQFAGFGTVMLDEYRKSKVALKLKGEVKDGKLRVSFDARDYLDRPVKGTAASYKAIVTRSVKPAKLTLNPEEFARQEGGPPTIEDLDVLPSDERLYALAHGVSVMTFAGFSSRTVGSREGIVPIDATGAATLDLDLQPEWLRGGYTIALSGVLTDDTGRENRASGIFDLTPNPSRGIRVSVARDLVSTGEKIPVTLTPFGFTPADKFTTTLLVVRLKARPEALWISTPAPRQNDDILKGGLFSALTPVREEWKGMPAFDPVKRGFTFQSVQPANNAAEITLDEPGAYKLLAVTKLADGSSHESETGIVVEEPAKLPSLVLRLDKREIDSGSRLTGVVHTRFSGAKLLLTLRDATGIKLMRPLTTGANGTVRIDEDIPANLRYGCAVSVQYPESRSVIHVDQRELFVIPNDRTIHITTTTPAQATPGEEINLGIQIDRQEEADLIVSAFDESLLSISGDLSKDIRSYYLADARGLVHGARSLAESRFAGLTINSLVEKATADVAENRDLRDHWKHNRALTLNDVVTLVRLAGLEVRLAYPFYLPPVRRLVENQVRQPDGTTKSYWLTDNTPAEIQIRLRENATLGDLLRWGELKPTDQLFLNVYFSATVIGNVALLGMGTGFSRGGAGLNDPLTDPWEYYPQLLTSHPGEGVQHGIGMSMVGMNGNYGIGNMMGMMGQYGNYGMGSGPPGGNGRRRQSLPPYQPNGPMRPLDLNNLSYMGMFQGMGGLSGIGGISSGFGGFSGGLMGMGGGMSGLQGGIVSPALTFPFELTVTLPALAAPPDDPIRSNFADSAYWSASVRTDKTGKASVTFKLPDSLTNWRVVVTAISSKMHVGTLTTRIKSARSVMVWPMLPRTFTEGDVVRVFGTVHNLTDHEQSMQVELKADNGEVVGLTEQKVKVPARGHVPVYWTYKAGSTGTTNLVMSARCEAGSDSARKHLPILSGDIVEEATASGLVSKGAMKINLPENFNPARASIRVTVAPSLGADLADTLPYLVEYPYGCIEQTMSRFLPAIRVAQILKQSGIDSYKEIESKLPGVVAAGQRRLINLQLSDGGWGWQGTAKTHEMMTPYALLGLIQSEEAGYPCPDPTTIERGMKRLRDYLATMETAWDGSAEFRRTRKGEINDSLFCLWVYASKDKTFDLTKWWQRVEGSIGDDYLSDYGHALALELAARKGKKELADKLAAELHKRAKMNGNRVNWTTAGFSHWGDNYNEITAAVLKAFVAHDPNDPLIAGILTYFADTKRGNRWDSTKDTACVLYAICDYLLRHERVGRPRGWSRSPSTVLKLGKSNSRAWPRKP